MRSMKEKYMGKGIGLVLGAIATFTLAFTAGAQSQGQGQSQSQDQGQSQGSGKAQAKKADKDSTTVKDGMKGKVKDGVGAGQDFGQGVGIDGWSGYLDDASAYAAQAKAMVDSAGDWKDLASDLKYNLKYDLKFNLKNDLQLDSAYDFTTFPTSKTRFLVSRTTAEETGKRMPSAGTPTVRILSTVRVRQRLTRASGKLPKINSIKSPK